jgi:hypothetical protein
MEVKTVNKEGKEVVVEEDSLVESAIKQHVEEGDSVWSTVAAVIGILVILGSFMS